MRPSTQARTIAHHATFNELIACGFKIARQVLAQATLAACSAANDPAACRVIPFISASMPRPSTPSAE